MTTAVFGTCPVCQKGYLLTKDGNVRTHQYRHPGRSRYEAVHCTGSGMKPRGA
jgi:hypothetical protein